MQPESLLPLVEHAPESLPKRIRSRDLAARWARYLGLAPGDLLLFLVDRRLHLLDAYRLPRPVGVERFPLKLLIRLAQGGSAEGIILIQERAADDVPRRPDLELTEQLTEGLRETQATLLDHLLICGEEVVSAGGLSRSKASSG